jgi:uncharacterized membrane protein
VKKAIKSSVAPVVILSIFIVSYVLVFSILSVDRHNRFQSLAFDLGIFDQAIWQFSTFSTPFNTVRGLHILGDHFTIINALISPLYWFFNDVRALLVLQTIVLAAAAIPLFLIAKHYFNNKWIPLVFCFSYLLFPALHYVNLEDYHTESFAPLLILLALYFIIKGKKWPYIIAFLLALTIKEEIALTMFLMGFYIYFMHDKKLGIFTSLFSLLWFVLAIKVFIPHFLGDDYIFTGRGVGNFGSGPVEIILGMLNPKILFPVLFNQTNATYMWELFSPVGFLALLNPPTLVISASLLSSLIVAWPYAHSIHYHYVTPIIPFLFISLVIGIARFKKWRILMYSLLCILVVSSLVANYNVAPYDATMKNYKHIVGKFKNFGIPSANDARIYELISLIPKNASVSATHDMVPHLTHRTKIYNFPNPFKAHYWGNLKEEPPFEYVDYLILSKGTIKDNTGVLQPLIENGTYQLVGESANIELLEKHK